MSMQKRQTKGNNPGNNKGGQLCSAKKHHTGPMAKTFVADRRARSKSTCKRLPTVLNKMKKMYTTSHTKWWARWETASGSKGSYSSPGCSFNSFNEGTCDKENQQPSTSTVQPVIVEDAATSAQYPSPPVQTQAEEGDIDAEEEGRRRRKKAKVSVCEICQLSHVGKGKRGKEKKICNWLKCELSSCDFWVHALCVGFVYKGDSDVKSVQYYCPTHIKKFM